MREQSCRRLRVVWCGNLSEFFHLCEWEKFLASFCDKKFIPKNPTSLHPGTLYAEKYNPLGGIRVLQTHNSVSIVLNKGFTSALSWEIIKVSVGFSRSRLLFFLDYTPKEFPGYILLHVKSVCNIDSHAPFHFSYLGIEKSMYLEEGVAFFYIL